ncbi:MBL fold metallo-hydrolase [Candidatus Falkowbacteria bacterium]|uniref:MBL fold metallo-hydrolase n=1 Tax=Candidatus Falkowbacteria bacterium CG10_big_fil_rev_8_21_14_0_10_37_18 TaxID=1974562 RepID=A0A2H0VBP6_9BACT|nr:MBL fold metallo-hydrolase [Candidatus Falkowbacteria bacterium]NCQ13150.1 MBL fold metallo-hydrolase [Candidatus Falkowbacteria bacterium]OIO06055.1 MAG: hypothetical protein AUJ26_01445 [Candidatus Falkowbacteria bacterium CG1_02_37_21]PIR95710.1 MAG: hypothetical protein COT93_01115 [Candidatus Falkowbacteria bacterium CG10_big_fil_rev_8_21_14_0_10_37_18]
MNTKIHAQFLGGVAYDDNLTGSSILITIEQGKQTTRLLLDAGLIQCYKQALERNAEILHWLRPEHIDGVILTHAHIDHVGRLPFLTKHGFKGKIYCTEGTRNLLPVMLRDSAKIQAKETLILRAKSRKQKQNDAKKEDFSRDKMTMGSYDKKKKKYSKNSNKIEPLYEMTHVEQTCLLIKNGGLPYESWHKLAKNVSLKLYPSGHILGGAICVIRIKSSPQNIYLGFSGDLGRDDGVILPPPKMIIEPMNYWFIESTYGGKKHPAHKNEITKLLNLIKEIYNSGKKMIMPSFALERAQEIIYLLSYYMQTKKIPPIPIFLDSPMAIEITQVFAANWNSGMFEGQDKLIFNPFQTGSDSYLKTITDDKSSVTLSETPGPYIVIAASGMCDAGRVRTHLRAGLGNNKTVVALVGYMAKNSLGRKLKDGLPIVCMNGEEILVKAKIVSFDSFSAHADGPHLVNYTKEVVNIQPQANKKIFIIHGEEEGATNLKMDLIDALPKGSWLKQIIIPKLGQDITL